MLGLGTYKLLPPGLMQVEQEITTAGQESHSKVCHPMDESSPAIQLWPSEKHALASLLQLWPSFKTCTGLSTPRWAVAAATAYTSGRKA